MLSHYNSDLFSVITFAAVDLYPQSTCQKMRYAKLQRI